jgi:L-threonate 2-dehydrogenase
MARRIGIIGLGKMGRACATNFMADGFEVWALERPSTLAFAKEGGRLAGSVAELVSSVDAVITLLATEEQMAETYAGAGGVIAHARPGLVVLEMGTFPVALKQPFADALRAKGAVMLDCPISGVPNHILQRTALVFASGEPKALASVQDIITSIGPKSVTVGDFGAGMATKLVANLLVIVNSMAVAEAMVLGNKSGLSSELILKTVGPSAGGSRVFDYRGPLMVNRVYRPAMGTAGIILKDLGYIRAHARAIGAATPLVETALVWFQKMIDQGRGEDECAGIYEVLREA